MEAEKAFDFEKMKEPFVDDDYTKRTGYDENFLGIPVPMPTVADLSRVAEMFEGGIIIPYEHFSVLMHKTRRLALFTASNIDASKKAKEPEPGFDYTRKGLSGLKDFDIEKWITDPRLDAANQLPDKFYTKDRKNFDKGHIVRRDDVAWGVDYEEVKRANGDTYHVTNCSPQVDFFNRSNKKGDWGRLENYVLKQGSLEKLCVFSGPVLDDDNDKIFRGKDDKGDVEVQIPGSFWKVIVARNGDRLETFAFLLEQDLTGADVEFNVSAEWQSKMLSIEKLQNLVPDVVFPDSIQQADQADKSAGEAVREAGSLIVDGGTEEPSTAAPKETVPPAEEKPAEEKAQETEVRTEEKKAPNESKETVKGGTVTWNDKESPKALEEALIKKNQEATGRLLDALCDDLDSTGRLIDSKAAKNVLALLRKYAMFDKLHQIAGKFDEHAQDDPQVLRQLAQARIELGEVTVAVDGLLELRASLEARLAGGVTDPDEKKALENELGESIGLLGRCYKKYYVDAQPSATEPREHDLNRSLEYYTEAYTKRLGDYMWHGINRVALLNHKAKIEKGKHNAISPEAKGAAEEILKAIDELEKGGKLAPWDLANRIEANLALGNTPAAVEATIAYLEHKDTDAFAVQSTRRQMIEVWLLDEDRPPGNEILPMMTARFAELGGGLKEVRLDPEKAGNYEKVWGMTKYRSLGWLNNAFERAKSVARIGTSKYDGDGTGFLFDGAWIAEEWAGKPLLLTNAHVCSNDPEVQKQIPYPAPPENLVAAFLGTEGAGAAEELRFEKLLWTSGPTELDATLLLLERVPDGFVAPPLSGRNPPVTMSGDARLNIIGHPKGLDLRVSLQDNKIVEVGDVFVHYTTPTDGGSSGSPVFNQDWNLVALHHASSPDKKANEGIRIDIIIEAVRKELGLNSE